MTQATVSRYVIVVLLLGNMTPLLHTLPQVTPRSRRLLTQNSN